MLVHLRLVHILDFFDHEVGNGCRTPVRIVVIINVYIVIIDDLNDFGGITFSQIQLAETHGFELLLESGVVAAGAVDWRLVYRRVGSTALR
jgi:hypothetical protein